MKKTTKRFSILFSKILENDNLKKEQNKNFL